MIMAWNVLSIIRLKFDYIEVISYNKKFDMGYKLSRRKHVRKVFLKSRKRRCNTVISHLNSNELNNLNT